MKDKWGLANEGELDFFFLLNFAQTAMIRLTK